MSTDEYKSNKWRNYRIVAVLNTKVNMHHPSNSRVQECVVLWTANRWQQCWDIHSTLYGMQAELSWRHLVTAIRVSNCISWAYQRPWLWVAPQRASKISWTASGLAKNREIRRRSHAMWLLRVSERATITSRELKVTASPVGHGLQSGVLLWPWAAIIWCWHCEEASAKLWMISSFPFWPRDRLT